MDVTDEPQGLQPHQGHLDHKVKLTGYPPRQRRNRLSAPEYEESKRQCIELFKEGKVRVSKSPYTAPILLQLRFERYMVQFEFVSIIERLMNAR